MTGTDPLVRYRVTGMDCADCASEIEKTARSSEAVEDAWVSMASHMLTLRIADGSQRIDDVERAVTTLGYQLDIIGNDAGKNSADSPVTQVNPAYRRALWIVVLLNVGYGVVELLGGFLSDSQALKADALDFLGDGAITMLGIIAIGWGLVWRARSALIQGVFLGALGIGVLANTASRLQAGYEPEAGMMGAFGLVALVVNVLAALALIPHRTGDANVRAVWLFSRNDAIGNLAVVIAAVLVAWTGTAWPDLVVAVVIASLFLHASWSIIADARRDLQTMSKRA